MGTPSGVLCALPSGARQVLSGHIAVHNNRGADLLVGPEIVAHGKLPLHPKRKAWGVGPPPIHRFCLRAAKQRVGFIIWVVFLFY